MTKANKDKTSKEQQKHLTVDLLCVLRDKGIRIRDQMHRLWNECRFLASMRARDDISGIIQSVHIQCLHIPAGLMEASSCGSACCVAAVELCTSYKGEHLSSQRVIFDRRNKRNAWLLTWESATASPFSKSRFGSELFTSARRSSRAATGLPCKCRLRSSGSCQIKPISTTVSSFRLRHVGSQGSSSRTFNASTRTSISSILFVCVHTSCIFRWLRR